MAGQRSFVCKNVPTDEGDKFVAALKDHGIAGIQKYATERLNAWRNVPLDIAITGEAGAGKSSYINAIRGLKVGEEGAAYTDVKEATKEVKSYEHPSNRHLVFWDLPGVGTENFKRDEYHDKVNLEKYDFFLIFSSERFSENDSWLAKEIRKKNKRFYFVRTKVYIDILTEPMSRANPRTKEELLDTIRADCLENLKKQGITDTPVYLIDNFKPREYDFGVLQAQLIEDAPQLKREVIAFTILGRSDSIILQKKKEMEKRIPIISLASAVAGAIPIPGVSTTVDVALMVKESHFYKEQFGLTEDAVKKSADMLGIQQEELRKNLEMQNFLINCTQKGLLALCREYVVSEAACEAVKIVIPIIGSAVSGVKSYKTTSHCLTSILEEMYEDSAKINKTISLHLAQSPPV